MRFRVRHVQQTVVDLATVELTARGWMVDPVNYGTTPVTIIEDVDIEDAAADLVPNTLAVTIPDEGPNEAAELGGGLYSVVYSLFFDCYGIDGTMATRILQDLKRALTDRVVPVVDYTGETPVETDEELEFDVVAVERPPGRLTEIRRRWRMMTVDATVYFPGEG